MKIDRDQANGQFQVSLDEQEFVAVASLQVFWEDPPLEPYYWSAGVPENMGEVWEEVDRAFEEQTADYQLTLDEVGLAALLHFLEVAFRQVGQVEIEMVTGYPSRTVAQLLRELRAFLKAEL